MRASCKASILGRLLCASEPRGNALVRGRPSGHELPPDLVFRLHLAVFHDQKGYF